MDRERYVRMSDGLVIELGASSTQGYGLTQPTPAESAALAKTLIDRASVDDPPEREQVELDSALTAKAAIESIRKRAQASGYWSIEACCEDALRSIEGVVDWMKIMAEGNDGT